MELEEFSTRLFALLEEENVVLTPLNVAFHLDLDVDACALLLQELSGKGELELVSGKGQSALFRRPGKSAYETSPVERSVSTPFSGAGVNTFVLVLGCLVPSVFIIVAILMAVFLDGFNKLWALIPAGIGLLWGVAAGIVGGSSE